MKIAHIAIWTDRLEEMRAFYVKYFHGISNEKYVNPVKGFESYFVRFEGGDTSLEIMRSSHIKNTTQTEHLGLCHFAFALENKEKVNAFTEQMRADGYPVLGEPRITGDGFYESIIADPDGNRVELVAENN